MKKSQLLLVQEPELFAERKLLPQCQGTGFKSSRARVNKSKMFMYTEAKETEPYNDK
jgi:hypothetical protein